MHSPAKAPQLSLRHTLLLPGGVTTPRKNSYAAKLIPTYGATPIAVVTSPRYSARTPPSSRMILSVMPHIVRSFLEYPAAFSAVAVDTDEDVWYAEASAGFAMLATDDKGAFCKTALAAAGCAAISDTEAVAIESRDRTRSKGYVEPA